MDTTAWFIKSVEDLTTIVHQIKDDQWTNDTPCTEWDVRALLGHLIYEIVWAPPLFEGKTIAEVGDVFEGDNLGDDPIGSWDKAAAAVIDAIKQPGVMERTAHLSFGDTSMDEYAKQVLMDLIVHRWDLAMGIGADTSIDDAEAEDLIEFFRPTAEAARKAGAFGDEVPIPEDATPKQRLIAMTGRTPD